MTEGSGDARAEEVVNVWRRRGCGRARVAVRGFAVGKKKPRRHAGPAGLETKEKRERGKRPQAALAVTPEAVFLRVRPLFRSSART